MRIKSSIVVFLAFVGLTALLALAADVVAGGKIFKKRKACHAVNAKKHKTGPHLVNLFGRSAGTIDEYNRYSEAMKSSGIVWKEETLDGYLEKPKAYIIGTRMAFAGLRKKADRINVVAYLKSYSN